MSSASREPLNAIRIDYATFLQQNLVKNRPALISGLSDDLAACRDWSTADGLPDWSRLSQLYGEQEVSITDCAAPDSTPQRRKLSDVITDWQSGRAKSCYVKDWHLALSGVPSFYETPALFRDDWMNEYALACTEDDFRFVYAGCRGTFTPIHRDVYGSYSWSTNIAGTKRWWLFPPHVSHHLRRFPRSRTSEMVHDVRDYKSSRFKDVALALTHVTIVDQRPGETIFVPSGWHHQVENTSDCISINHNWCNSTCIAAMYQGLCEAIEDVEAAVEDVKADLRVSATHDWEIEWTATVQRVLKLDAGWDCLAFWQMISHMLKVLEGQRSSTWRPPLTSILDAVEPCMASFESRRDLATMSDETRAAFSEAKRLCEVLRRHVQSSGSD